MPQDLGGHADVTGPKPTYQHQMAVTRTTTPAALADMKDSTLASDAVQPISPRPQASTAAKDKQSLDYVLRTGFAGGLAGCAVSPAEQEAKQCL